MTPSPPPQQARFTMQDPVLRTENEKKLGITQRAIAVNLAWTGDNRKRYTDFIVNEIKKDGTVVHLYDYEEPPKPQVQAKPPSNVLQQQTAPKLNEIKTTPFNSAAATTRAENEQTPVEKITENDQETLTKLIGDAPTQALISLDEKIQAKASIPGNARTVEFPAISDRDQRTSVHQEIRRIFKNRFQTTSDGSGVITAEATKSSSRGGRNWGQRRGNNRREDSFQDLGGEYLHFTLYKENKDTMEAINTIGRMLKVKSPSFGFAGTKDRRASTSQRVSVRYQRKTNLIWLNTRLPGIKIGDFKHSKYPIQLGHLAGNEFHITIKNCQPIGVRKGCSLDQRFKMIQASVELGLAYLKTHGYINYFGLQRFGTYTIGTHLLGMKILRGEYADTVRDILHVEAHLVEEVLGGSANNGLNRGPGHRHENRMNDDDLNRARAIVTWNSTKKSAAALPHLPKRFSSEYAIINHLGRQNQSEDYMGALLSITRGMRMMYIHAYQSFVWNHVASERWSRHGAKVIVGDLVLIDDVAYVDVDGDAGSDETRETNIDEEEFYAQARPLNAADVESGKYTIFDVVLPQPGFDVIYPQNDIGDYYVSFMARPENGALNPYEMRRPHKEFSLSGNYRHLMGRFLREPEYAMRLYSQDTEQMLPTDLDICEQKKAAAEAAEAARLEARNAMANKWSQFTENVKYYDDQMDKEQRRRKATESPPSERVVRTTETWMQTGLDDDNKRVKITRHRFETVHMHDETTLSTASDEKSLSEATHNTSVEPRQASPTPTDISAIKPAEPTLSSISNIETTPTSKTDVDASSSAAGLATPITVTARKGSSDASCESATQEKAKLSPLNEFQSWYQAKLSEVSGISDAAYRSPQNSQPHSVTQPASKQNDGTINGVKPITFRKVPDNPITALAAENDPAMNGQNADGDKIAVVLKFQLKSSNYATIVLRELMGPDGDEGSRPGSRSLA